MFCAISKYIESRRSAHTRLSTTCPPTIGIVSSAREHHVSPRGDRTTGARLRAQQTGGQFVVIVLCVTRHAQLVLCATVLRRFGWLGSMMHHHTLFRHVGIPDGIASSLLCPHQFVALLQLSPMGAPFYSWERGRRLAIWIIRPKKFPPQIKILPFANFDSSMRFPQVE